MDSNQQVLNLLEQLTKVQGVPENEPQAVPDKAERENEPDPTIITTYKEALRHTVYYTVQNAMVVDEIKRLIDDQNRMEKQWFESRRAIEEKQKTRHEGQQELANVFKLVGGASTKLQDNSRESHEKELILYDQKVYKFLVEMATRHHQILSDMRVPLFCIREDIKRPQTLTNDRRRLLQFLQELID